MIKKINKKNKSLSEYVHDFIIEIRRPTYMTPFKTPVDPMEVPHYFTVIKQPMDLQTMYQKLLEGKYGSLGEVRSDFDLIITNCETFNPPGTWIRPVCDKFRTNLEKSWSKMLEIIARKGIDINKPMEKLPDLDEIKETQNLIVLPDLGLRTRNQTSIIKDSLNESMEFSNNNSNNYNKMEFSNNNSNNYNNMGFMAEGGLERSRQTSVEKLERASFSQHFEERMPNMIVINKASFSQSYEDKAGNFKKTYCEPSLGVVNMRELKMEENIDTNTLKMEEKIESTSFSANLMKMEEESNTNANKNTINNPLIEPVKKEAIIPEIVPSDPPLKPIKMETPPNDLKIEEEEGSSNEFLITLDIESIKTEFNVYSEQRLHKYRKSITKTVSKLYYILSTFEQDTDLISPDLQRVVTELEVVKLAKSIDYDLLTRCLIKFMVFFRRFSLKIKETKTNKRVLSYFSMLLKALKRINSLSKKAKSLGIPPTEEMFLAQDYGIGFFREELQKAQAIFNQNQSQFRKPESSLYQNASTSNSIKITLPKPREKPENEPFFGKIQRKIAPERTNPMSSPSTKIVLNKDMNKVKNFSLERPLENKTDRLFSWVAGINTKVYEKIEGYFNSRLVAQQTSILKKEEEEKNEEREKNQRKTDEDPTNIKGETSTTPLFEERKAPIEFFLSQNRKTTGKTNVFKSGDASDSEDDSNMPLRIVSSGSNPPPIATKKLTNFSEIQLNRRILLKTTVSPIKTEPETGFGKVTLEDISIYSLFKEIAETEKLYFDETTKNLKRANNDKLKSMKYEKIVDKSSRTFLEISEEVTLDKIMSITLKLEGIEEADIEIENVLNVSSYELFTDLKRVHKVNELTVVENSHWLSYETLSNKLMKQKLFDALLNQLIKAAKYTVDKQGGIFYYIERSPGETGKCSLSIWTAVQRLTDFKLKISGLTVF